MEVAYISALSALAGSVVGGLTSGVTTWMALRSQTRAGRLAGQFALRQELFRDFMIAAAKTYGNALTNNEPKIAELVDLYASISRMRVLCSLKIVTCADNVMRMIIDTYLGPNRTVREVNELIKNGSAIDPLKEFSDVAREELQAFAVR
jgi:hypothetical protein